MSGAAEAPKPPGDPELRNIIDKLAQFVARNGPDFENMTKQKQKDNPRFGFLFGGEYFQYYMYKVNAEQAIMRKQKMQAEQTTTAQKQALQQQLHESEKNLQLQFDALMQQQQAQIDDATFTAERDENRRLAEECDIILDEFSSQLDLITVTCSKEAITSNKNWFIGQCHSPTHAEIILKYLIYRIKDSDASFTFKLHVLYLLNDLIHHYMRKQNDAMLSLIGNYVTIMFSMVYVTHSHALDDSNREKLNKLRSIWETQNYFSTDIMQKLQNVHETFNDYKQTISRNYPNIVDEIVQKIRAQCQQYETQHLEYARHIQQQMNVLEGRPPVNQLPPFQSMPPLQMQHSQQQQQTAPYRNQPQAVLGGGSAPTNGNAPPRRSRFDAGPPLVAPVASSSTVTNFSVPPPGSSSPASTPVQSLSANFPSGTASPSVLTVPPPLMVPPAQSAEMNSGFSPSSAAGKGSPLAAQSGQFPPPRPPAWQQGHMPDFANMGHMPYGPRIPAPFPPHGCGAFPPPRYDFSSAAGGPPGTPPRSLHQGSAAGGGVTPLMSMTGLPPPPQPLFPPVGMPTGMFMGVPGGAGGPPIGPNAQWNQRMAVSGPQAWPPRPGMQGSPVNSIISQTQRLRLPSLLDGATAAGGLIPKVPYYDLPAALMVPLVDLADNEYKPLDPSRIRLPPPMPPSERLLAAVEAFYAPPNHENPRDSDGWEKLGLYEFHKAKQNALHKKERGNEPVREGQDENGRDSRNSRRSGSYSSSKGSRSRSRSAGSRSRSVSPGERRSRSMSRSRSRSGSRSRSRTPS